MKIEVSVKTSKVGSEMKRVFEVDDKDWDEATDEEKDSYCQEFIFGMISWDYKVRD